MRSLLIVATLFLLTLTAVAAPGPTDTYKEYLKVLSKATAMSDIFPYIAASKVAEMKKALKPGQEAMLLMLLKSATPGDLKLSGEKITGDKAVLKASGTEEMTNGKKQKSDGTIEMVKEQGRWKIESENWKIGPELGS